jgi:hypothetical protein
MYTLSEMLGLVTEGKIEYPADHEPGLRVTKGGSMCANCEYWVEKGNLCNNKYLLQWHDGDAKVPAPADEYCCNWWHAK